MLIIHAVKSGTLWDLYFREVNNLVWFGCLAGDEDPKQHKDGIINLFNVCEPDYAEMYSDVTIWTYEKKG